MNIPYTSRLSRIFIFALALMVSAAGNALQGQGYHGHGHGSNQYHRGGGYYYHGGGGYSSGGWGGPAIVIGVPLGGYYAPRYYAPICETVRVCNQYRHCWLQQECN